MTTHTYTYRARRPFWGMLLIVVGVAVLGDNLHWWWFDVWDVLWPAVLIVIGLELFVRGRRRIDIPPAPAPSGPAGAPAAAAPAAAAAADGEVLNESHLMGEIDAAVESKAFRGGTVSTVFGEIRLDCTRALLADGEHSLTASTVFGEIHIVLPVGWEYSVDATTVLGEVEAAQTRRGGVFSHVVSVTQGYAGAARRLRIHVSTVFGEVRVVAR